MPETTLDANKSLMAVTITNISNIRVRNGNLNRESQKNQDSNQDWARPTILQVCSMWAHMKKGCNFEKNASDCHFIFF